MSNVAGPTSTIPPREKLAVFVSCVPSSPIQWSPPEPDHRACACIDPVPQGEPSVNVQVIDPEVAKHPQRSTVRLMGAAPAQAEEASDAAAVRVDARPPEAPMPQMINSKRAEDPATVAATGRMW